MNDDQLNRAARPAARQAAPVGAPSWQTVLVRQLLTRDRVMGYSRHLAQWLSVWLMAKGWLGEGNVGLLYGAILNIALIILSWNSETKETLYQQIGGVVRHVLTMVMAVVVFKGWLSDDQAHQVQEAVVGFILSSASSATAGEKFTPGGEEVSDAQASDGQ